LSSSNNTHTHTPHTTSFVKTEDGVLAVGNTEHAAVKGCVTRISFNPPALGPNETGSDLGSDLGVIYEVTSRPCCVIALYHH
jgi:hypothetical protein